MTLDETIKCTKEIAEWLEDYKRLLAQQPNIGYWREVDTNEYTCSNCNYTFSIVPEDNSIEEYKYCPNCITKMIKIKDRYESEEDG